MKTTSHKDYVTDLYANLLTEQAKRAYSALLLGMWVKITEKYKSIPPKTMMMFNFGDVALTILYIIEGYSSI